MRGNHKGSISYFRRVEKLILNKYRNRSRACGEAARSMREDHQGLPSYVYVGFCAGCFEGVAFMSETRTWLRPFCLAAYRAWSARSIRDVNRAGSAVAATPMLIVSFKPP